MNTCGSREIHECIDAAVSGNAGISMTTVCCSRTVLLFERVRSWFSIDSSLVIRPQKIVFAQCAHTRRLSTPQQSQQPHSHVFTSTGTVSTLSNRFLMYASEVIASTSERDVIE